MDLWYLLGVVAISIAIGAFIQAIFAFANLLDTLLDKDPPDFPDL